MYPKAKPTAAEATKPADGKSDRRAMGRFGVLNRFSDHGARLVDTTAQACWWILFRETQPDGLATVSHQRIAECVGVSSRTVARAIDRLKSAGLLIMVRHGGWQKGPNTYRLRPIPKGSPATNPNGHQ
jgi:biotin operon repressor